MAYEFDDDIVSRYLNNDEKTKTDALFEKINDSSRARASRKHAAPSKHSRPVKQPMVSKTKPITEKVEKRAASFAQTAELMEKISQTDCDIYIKESGKEILEKADVIEKISQDQFQKDENIFVPYNPKKGLKDVEKLKKQQTLQKIKKKKTWQAIALSFGSFITVVVVGLVCIAYSFFGGLQINKIDEENLGINHNLHSDVEAIDPNLTKITNIALFGIDAREGETESRSDAIMIMSINPMSGKIKLISILRDSYVDISGEGWWDKLTHAYYYGGPEMAIKALNVNFGLNISDYVTVDFGSMAEAIDALGGVYIDVDEDELYHVNLNMREINWDYPELYDTGYVLLNGEQAVGYARIRAIDGDQQRTGRQREVVMAAFDRVKDMDITTLPNLAKTVIPMIETSMSYSEIISFIPMLANDITMEQAMIPGQYDGAYDAIIDEVYYMGYDLEVASKHIYDFIYNDIHPDTDPALLEPSTEESDTYNTDDEYTTTE